MEQEQQQQHDALTVDPSVPEVEVEGSKYVLPPSIYFLKQKRRIPLSELSNLIVVADKRGKMTVRGEAVAEDGKLHRASTYLGIKKDPNAPKKKRVRTKKAKIEVVKPAEGVVASAESS
jgi:hypothetical protein